jgi:hypothetical protein
MGSAATPKLRARLREVLATLLREIVRARAQDMLRVDKRGRLREIKCPMLCLHGRSDRLVSKKHVDEIVAAQPGCEVYWLDSSHMLLATHTEAAARVIENFCEHLNFRERSLPLRGTRVDIAMSALSSAVHNTGYGHVRPSLIRSSSSCVRRRC